jgi:hypothetical protein
MQFPKEIFVRQGTDKDDSFYTVEETPDAHAIVGERVSVACYVIAGTGIVSTDVRFSAVKK